MNNFNNEFDEKRAQSEYSQEAQYTYDIINRINLSLISYKHAGSGLSWSKIEQLKNANQHLILALNAVGKITDDERKKYKI